jgi:plasmid stabilization system protein ParE
VKRYRVGFSVEALDQLERVRPWWVANRRAAPELFDDELLAALATLEAAPNVGSHYAHPRTAQEIRRLLMPRTRYHIYYLVDEASLVVWILAVWHASRGSEPTL